MQMYYEHAMCMQAQQYTQDLLLAWNLDTLTVHFTAQPCTNLQLMSAVWLEPPQIYLEEAVQNDPEHQVYVFGCRRAATQTLPSH